LFGGDTVALRDKLEYWLEFYKPSGQEERAWIERAVLASTQECRCLAAAHLRVSESVDPAEADAAILGCPDPGQAGANRPGERKGDPVLALFLRYARDHHKVFHNVFSALLDGRAEPVTTAVEPALGEAVEFSDEAEGGARQFGYY
jgi:hypothetical protein